MTKQTRTAPLQVAAAAPSAIDAALHRSPPRLLRLPEVLAIYPVSKPALYKAIRDRKFPRPCKLLGGRGSAWDAREVSAFIEARLAERTGN
jgi:predicted DNA-binding transcriptional regulator AlpA